MPELEYSDKYIADFWQEFSTHEKDLRSLTTIKDPLYDYILVRLQKINPGLYFEISIGPGLHTLIITAEGQRELFELVEAIVRQAPQTPGWKVFALKPQEEFPVRVSWMDYSLEISQVFFSPLGKKGSDELGLEFLIPGLKDEDVESCHNAILRAVDHGLGERRFAECVAGTMLTPLPADAPTDDLIPLVRLDDFIKWREQNKGNLHK